MRCHFVIAFVRRLPPAFTSYLAANLRRRGGDFLNCDLLGALSATVSLAVGIRTSYRTCVGHTGALGGTDLPYLT